MSSYRTLVIDPPWMFRQQPPSAKPTYALMTLDAIKRLPIPEMADTDSHLYLWVPNAFLSEGLEVVKAWGFTYKTVVTWAKHQMGLGSYFRNATEQILFGIRGRLPVQRHDVRTWFLADRRQHSRKPDDFYRIVESVSPPARIDIFSREHREGWDQWGDQCDFFNSAKGAKNERDEVDDVRGSGIVSGGVKVDGIRLDER